jgi:hypothetical protein
MVTINQRLLALENSTMQTNQNIHVVICKGAEPTQEERAQAAGYESTIFVLFGLSQGAKS